VKLQIASLRRVTGASASAFALAALAQISAASAEPAAAGTAPPLTAPLVPATMLAAAADPTPPPSDAAGGTPTQDNSVPAVNGSGTKKILEKRPTPQAPAGAFTGLLGDFGGGERSRLRDEGITVNLHIVSEGAGNVTGGLPTGPSSVVRGTAIANELGGGIDVDFAKLFKAPGAGALHVLVTTREGGNLAATSIGSLVSVQEIYGDGQTTRFTYLEYEQPLFHNAVNVVFGKYNQQNDFIAGSSYWGGNLYCFYQNNNICGTPAAVPINNGIVPGGTEGYDYYPTSQWGGRIRFNFGKSAYFQVAALQGNAYANSAVGGTYFGFNGAAGTELPAEVGFTFRNAAGDPTGNLRFGAYYDTSTVEDYTNRLTPLPGIASNAAALALHPQAFNHRGRNGGDIQFDHTIGGSSLPGKTGTAFWAAGEYGDASTALIGTMFDAGIVRHGTFAARPLDTFSIGYAQENFNKRLQNLEASLQSQGYAVPYNSRESAVEVNYGIAAAPWMLIRPGLQYVINPNGLNNNHIRGFTPPGDALVLGLSSVIQF